MAFSNNSLNSNRGLDPHAMRVLDMRKQKREDRDNDLKRKQAEREINSIRNRVTIIEREIERLSVTGRRSKGDIARTEQELQEEVGDVLKLTAELGEHEKKIHDLEKMLGAKKGTFSRLRSIVSRSGKDSSAVEIQRIRDELKRVEQELDQLQMKRKRLVTEMSQVQQKQQKAYEAESKFSAEMSKSQAELEKMMQEMEAERSVFNRMRARYSRENKDVLQKQREVEDARNRSQGSGTGIPALEREKQMLEQKIKNLEKELN